MKSKTKIVIIIALVIFILDHLTKWLIVQYVPMGSEVTVIPGIFDIVHGRNTGAAFGFLSTWDSPFRNFFFYGMGIVALVFLYNYLKGVAESDKISITALGLILGGAMGNIFDRLWRGSVVDFLSFHYDNQVRTFDLFGKTFVIPLTWPAFNVADSAITVAVTLLILQSFRKNPVA